MSRTREMPQTRCDVTLSMTCHSASWHVSSRELISRSCAAVCCSVMQCVAVWCSVLQCVAVCCSVMQCVAVCCSVCCNVLQCVAVCCSVVQCVTNSPNVMNEFVEMSRWTRWSITSVMNVTNKYDTPRVNESKCHELTMSLNKCPKLAMPLTMSHKHECVTS